MKYSEFNNDWSDMELQYLEGEVFVYCDGVMIGKVSKEYRYMMSTHYAGFEELPLPVAVKLFADMAMLAQTPLAEREEEKRYYLRLVVPPLLRTGHAKPSYFVIRRIDGSPDTSYSPMEYEGFQKIFTESEIAQMDITGFKKIEVVE